MGRAASSGELASLYSIELSSGLPQVKDSAVMIWHGVTNNGTLFFNTEEPIIPPTPAPKAKSLTLRSPLDLVKRHPYIFGVALSSLVGVYCYVRPPPFLLRVPGLRALGRPGVLAVRPRKLEDGTRLDAVLVIGAERGGLGREIALDLERRGFVVLATVPNASEVDALERLGRGHIKALVLDPTEQGTIPPLLRSLSTSLSLRFPLHTPGDPYRSQHQSPSLCAVVNCLALATHCSTAQSNAPLGPLEATSLESLKSLFQSRVIASLGVLQGTLPLLRSAPGRASVITLVPASTSRVALPYVGSQSIADSALAAMNDALRREVSSDKVAVSTIDVGFFARVHHGALRCSLLDAALSADCVQARFEATSALVHLRSISHLTFEPSTPLGRPLLPPPAPAPQPPS